MEQLSIFGLPNDYLILNDELRLAKQARNHTPKSSVLLLDKVRKKMFTRELPEAVLQERHILGILRLPLIPASRDSRGAQDDRVRTFSTKLRHHRVAESLYLSAAGLFRTDSTHSTSFSFRYCIALKNALFSSSPQWAEPRPVIAERTAGSIFDKKQIAIGKWQQLANGSNWQMAATGH